MLFDRWLYVSTSIAVWCSSAIASNNDGYCADKKLRWSLFSSATGITSDIGVCTDLSSQEDEQCFRDSLLLRKSADNYTLWASLMMDASSGAPSGMLHGSRFHLGSYDGCLAAGRISPVGSRYCLARYTFEYRRAPVPAELMPANWTDWQDIPDPYTDSRDVVKGIGRFPAEVSMRDVWVALCVPQSCGPTQLESAIFQQSLLHDKRLGGIYVDPNLCSTTAESQGSIGLLIYGIGIAALATLAAISTALDMTGMVPTSARSAWVMSWSVPRRWKGLVAPEQSLNGLELQPMAGIRVITLGLLVAAHHCMHLPRTPTLNNFVTRKVYEDPFGALASEGFLYVYTMFFLSGLFIAVASRTCYFRSIVLRYLRLTPSYLAVVAFYALALPAAGDGPRWKEMVTSESDGCANLWWTNILYVNNYVRLGTSNGCVLQSWSLAVDMQLCIIATFLLMFEKSWKRTARILWIAALAFSFAAPFVTTILGLREPVWRFLPTVLEDLWGWKFWNRYVSTEQWALPYLIGILTGSFLERSHQSGYTLPLRTMRILVVSSAVFLLLFVVSGIYWNNPGMQQHSLLAGVYATSVAAGWSACLAIVSVALVLGPKGSIQTFLGAQPFALLSRLGYSIYLVHFGAQITQVARMRTLRYVSTLNVIGTALLEAICILPICLGLYLLIEAPIREVSKGVFRSKSKEQSNNGLPLQRSPFPSASGEGKLSNAPLPGPGPGPVLVPKGLHSDIDSSSGSV